MPESQRRIPLPRSPLSRPPPLPLSHSRPPSRSLPSPPPLPAPRPHVTATEEEAAATEIAEAPPAPADGPNETLPTTASANVFDSTDSALVTLSPPLLESLRTAAPETRRGKLPYIVGLGLLAVVLGVVGANRSTREFMAQRWHHAPLVAPRAAAPPPSAEPATGERTVPPTAMSAPQVEEPVVPDPAATASASGTAAIPKKVHRRRRAAPHAQEKGAGSAP